jgi:hypothetical protein
MRFGDLNGVSRLFQIRACHHELLATGVQSTLEDVIEIVFMSLRAMVFSSKDGIPKVDTDLKLVKRFERDAYACIN